MLLLTALSARRLFTAPALDDLLLHIYGGGELNPGLGERRGGVEKEREVRGIG